MLKNAFLKMLAYASTLGAPSVLGPKPQPPRVIHALCGGTERTGCKCEPHVKAMLARAADKRARKGNLRNALVEKGALIRVPA